MDTMPYSSKEGQERNKLMYLMLEPVYRRQLLRYQAQLLLLR